MPRTRTTLGLGAAILWPALAGAMQPAARVLLLQTPAWVERDNHKIALGVGMSLQSADRIITGEEARVMLRLEEGSHVKLGADAELALDSLLPPQDADGLVAATGCVSREDAAASACVAHQHGLTSVWIGE